jgi:uncharacterized protein YciI
MADHFVYMLIPPRPTFPADITEAETAIMGRHALYWRALVDEGRVVVFGPVADPAGTWGLAVVAAASLEEARALGEDDPAVSSGMAAFVVYAMPSSVVRS